MGNESGNGNNFSTAEKAIKRLDTTRPTHYEGNSSFCDVTSCMYPSVDWLENVGRERLEKIQKGEIVKPHVVCEYAHAMGNSIGNFKEYWETYERYPALIGGFIWDWVDQSLRMPTPDGKGFYMAVGGDFGDKPNDGNFCTNGVIFSDRTLSAKSYEMKKIHQPIRIEALGNGKYRISNKRFHANMEDLYGRYEITEDGRTVCSGNLEDLKLEAQASKVITLPDIPATKVPGAEYFINFSFCQKRDTEWAKADYEVATEQFKLSSSEKPIFVPEKGNINLNETADALVVKGERFEAVFSKEEGTLSAYTLNNIPLISKGLELNLFRAPTDNDKQVSGDWQRKGLYQLQAETGKWETHQEEDRITLHIRNCHKGKLGFEYRTEIEYTVNADGSIMVNSVIMPVSDGEIIPRVGYRMELPEGFERMRWYGRGPWENYSDRKASAMVSIYNCKVSALGFDYVMPQENGNRCDVRWFALQSDKAGVMIVGDEPLSVSVWEMSQNAIDKAKHINELEKDLYSNTLNIDLVQAGVGGTDSWSLKARPSIDKRLLKGSYSYGFTLFHWAGMQILRKMGQKNILVVNRRLLVIKLGCWRSGNGF